MKEEKMKIEPTTRNGKRTNIRSKMMKMGRNDHFFLKNKGEKNVEKVKRKTKNVRHTKNEF